MSARPAPGYRPPNCLPGDPPDQPRDGSPEGDGAPRFAVGQLVMVRSHIDPARNTDCTTIIDRQWYEGEADWGWYAGWQYIVAKHVDAWAVESSLRPRPEPGELDWQALRDALGIGPPATTTTVPGEGRETVAAG